MIAAAGPAIPDRSVDRAVLIGAIAVVGLSALLEPGADVVRLFGWPVPPMCAFSVLTGWSCPGCGLTRSFAYVAHGELVASFGLHALGPALFLAVLAQVPYRAWRLWRPSPPPPGGYNEGSGG